MHSKLKLVWLIELRRGSQINFETAESTPPYAKHDFLRKLRLEN